MRPKGKASHAGFIAQLSARANELERKVAMQDREILRLRRHAASTPSGRSLIQRLRVDRMAWLDEIRPERRDVP